MQPIFICKAKENSVFCSRDPVYRNPVGAVVPGTKVHFKITVEREKHCSAVRLVLSQGAGTCLVLGLFWCGMNGYDREWWECDFVPSQPGLWFYHFEMDTADGRIPLGRSNGGEAAFGSTEDWQITVYSKAFETPDWLAGGILYQIFPDRFFCSGTPKRHVPQDRRLHASWEEQPQWQPDADGEITNQDYFGGDLKGIEEKLPYLQSLGVTSIYLNPIFEAHSNHRYNTADYSKIDPMLGTEADFRALCAAAKQKEIRILLDGVFSHTGSDSIYFNRNGRYGDGGAYRQADSPYRSWYSFSHWPDRYDCWWGFLTLPNTQKTDPGFCNYINGESGIVRKWLAAGASGWRLDVADELPDPFLQALRTAAKAEASDALVLGEVWEDASNKCAYGKRRRYLLGDQLDSVMNYPFRDAVLGFVSGRDAAQMLETIMRILEHYPPQVVRVLMNHIGTHDTERALTVLAGEPAGNRGRAWQSAQKLSDETRKAGLRKMRLASLMQYTLPGVPCIYYGDEAGMEGYRDPFNRGTYPWGQEEQPLLDWYRTLGALRRENPVFREGSFQPVFAAGNTMAYCRTDGVHEVLIALHAADCEAKIPVPACWETSQVKLGSLPENGMLSLPPQGYAWLERRAE
ncbi:glycoside hydrolase family 13 protein [Yeguia hominis]|uniref:glycoside hydrolase family 13 protein n=1 Tax=Yeguia hominis TaxID=2763662 RepID=UPI0020164CAC